LSNNNSNEEKNANEMRVLVGDSLLFGVILSTAIVAVGLILMFVETSTGYNCDLSSLSCLLTSVSTSPGVYPSTFTGIIQGLVQAKPYAIIELGIIVLIATPVVRVITSLGVFAAEKDTKFIAITLVVLVILLFSFFVVPFIPLFKA